MPAAATATKAVAIVTTDELIELANWERKYAEAKRKVSEAEKELEYRRQSLAEKTLGVKSADELKKMPPGKVIKLLAQRLADGDWRPERGAPMFTFTKTSEGARPAWKQIYIEEFGETAAAAIVNETPTTYSYRIDVAAS